MGRVTFIGHGLEEFGHATRLTGARQTGDWETYQRLINEIEPDQLLSMVHALAFYAATAMAEVYRAQQETVQLERELDDRPPALRNARSGRGG